MNNTGRAFLGAVVALLAIPVMLIAALGGAGGGDPTPIPCGTAAAAVGQKLPSGTTLTGEMFGNARIIAQVGHDLAVTEQGVTIALATSLVETELRNLDHGDRDSVGLFQQRPSQGWGTVAQLMDPNYSARAFYLHLLAIEGWEDLAPGAAAQLVQNSGYPDRYAARVDDATSILASVTGTDPDENCTPARGAMAIVPAPAGGTIIVSPEISADLGRLLDDAEAAGILLAGGGFRSPEQQIELRRKNCGPTNYDIYEKPSSQCTPHTARPGYSLHEAGLAVDFTCGNRTDYIDRGDPCDRWLSTNATAYGFHVLADGTEPWHYSKTGG